MMRIQANSRFDEAENIVSRIDHSFKSWSALSLQQRIKQVRSLRHVISKNAGRIAEIISEECGRPLMESLSQEVLPVLEMARYCEKKFPRWISSRRLPYRRPGFWRKKNYFFYEAIGPIAVFSPQNFPFSLGMMTLIYALLPGNTVVLKPSEKSTLVPSLIEELLRESGLIDSSVVSILAGDARTGNWLIGHPKVRKIFFFGQQLSGRTVAETCVKHFKPFVLEMGGGSTAYVCADADINKAAAGLAWSSFYASGRSCVSTERILVDNKIAGEFISLFKERVQDFQKEVISSTASSPKIRFKNSWLKGFIEEAKLRGADVFYAGLPNPQENDESLHFTVIADLPPSLDASCDELFGPVVLIRKVSNREEAITEINKRLPSMGISIWSKNCRQSTQLAKKISAGMIWINDSSVGLPNLPWGGGGKAGWGKLFSEFSVQEVTKQKWISVHPGRFSRPRFWWSPYTSRKVKLMMKISEYFF